MQYNNEKLSLLLFLWYTETSYIYPMNKWNLYRLYINRKYTVNIN